MRKVTYNVANAFYNGVPFTCGNTFVGVSGDNIRMYLHGNLIAEREAGTGTLTLTLAGWNTPTTRERVNGILNLYRERNHWEDHPSFSTALGIPKVRQGKATDNGYAMDWRDIESTSKVTFRTASGDIKAID